MLDELLIIQKLLASILVGYLLGSIPFAHLAARFKGVDIFATGNRRAGTANVFWNVSRRTAFIVLAGDVAKGALAVTIAGFLDLSGPMVILAGGAAVLGHWKSIFTRFRGGDGMATLMGATLALAPLLALLGTLIGIFVVLLVRKSPYRSAMSLVSCFATLLAISQYYDYYREPMLGLSILATLVLFHNVFIHRRVAGTLAVEELDLTLDLDEDLDEDPEIGHAASENV